MTRINSPLNQGDEDLIRQPLSDGLGPSRRLGLLRDRPHVTGAVPGGLPDRLTTPLET